MWMDVWSCGCRERYPHEWGQEGPGRTESGRPTTRYWPWPGGAKRKALWLI